MSEGLCFDVSVTFPGFRLAAKADVPGHGITALSGPSGSGKTTLLRAIAGLEPAARGSVRFSGQDWAGLPAAARGIGYVFQDARLFPHLDVRANLDYGARRRGVDAARVAQVVEALDLAPLLDRAPQTLSGGEARRVALGRALASGPRLLLMDEPLAGLDRARKTALMPYIARAVATFGVPAIHVSHSAHEIAALADRVLTLEQGRITGKAGPAPRLTGRICETRAGAVCLELGAIRLWLPGSAQPGDRWSLPLGLGYVLSTRDPGQSTAPLCLQGAVATGPAPGTLRVDFGDQTLTLPQPGGEPLSPGQPVWLILPEVTGYPNPAPPA